MAAKRALLVGLVLCFMNLMFAQSLAFAEVTMRILGVPDRLSFPLPKGTNIVLTATIKGGEVRGVWLSRNRDAQARFKLVPVGGGAYQVNLADRVLSAMIRAEGTGQFQIFVETSDGHIVASVPMHYAVTEPARMPPRIYVYVDGKKTEILSPSFAQIWEDMAMLTHVSDSSLWVLPAALPPGRFGTQTVAESYFLSPEHVDKIEVRFEEDAVGPVAEACVGEKTWSLRASNAANVLNLGMTAEIRSAWKEHGNLELMCSQAGMEEMRVVLKAPSKRLNLAGDSVKMTIIQRHLKEVPGSEGYVRIYIDDITAAQVLLSITTADGQTLVDQTSVRRGDEVTFTVGEGHYKLTVEKLVNFIAGDDYGAFTVSQVTPPEVDERAEREKIERLMDIIEESDVIFIRNDREYTPAGAAEHIRKKYEYAHEEIRTAEGFIDRVAGRSWISGRDYLVRLPDGREIKAKRWLRDQLAKLPQSEEQKQ